MSDAKATKVLSAKEILDQATKVLGGGGGGRDDLAQGKGKDPSKIDEAITAVIEALKEKASALAS